MAETLWREAREDEEAEGAIWPQPMQRAVLAVRVPAGALLIEDGFDKAVERMCYLKVGNADTVWEWMARLLRAAVGKEE